MTQIKIEVPANDTIALSALGAALTRIAAERATPTVSGGEQTFTRTVTLGDQSVTETTTTKGDVTPNTESDDERTQLEQTVNELHAQVDETKVELPELTEQVTPPTIETDDTIDADGLPWDKRIHSRGKSRLADNTWRLARKPADKSQDEWNEYVETVKAELKAVQSIAPPEVDDQPEHSLEGVTPNGDLATEAVLPPVPTQETKEFDEAVLPPVETVAPPVVETPPVEAPSETDNSVTTFPELMKWITSVAKKRGADNDMIKAVLADIDPALAGLPLLATRADLIPTFVTKLEERLA